MNKDHIARPPHKRSRATTGLHRGETTYPRQRALTACHICRIRKIKCSNDRPTCASCSRQGVTCIYDDGQAEYSSFDPASLAILEKLNEVLDRLPADHGQHAVRSQPQIDLTAHQVADSAMTASLDTESESSITLLDRVRAYSGAEHLLEWPVFAEHASAQRAVSAIFSTNAPDETCIDIITEDHLPHQPVPHGSAGQQLPVVQNVLPLVNRYLLNVHHKHPFLDVAHIRTCAALVDEMGPAWDPPSCLVVSLLTSLPRYCAGADKRSTKAPCEHARSRSEIIRRSGPEARFGVH